MLVRTALYAPVEASLVTEDGVLVASRVLAEYPLGQEVTLSVERREGAFHDAWVHVPSGWTDFAELLDELARYGVELLDPDETPPEFDRDGGMKIWLAFIGRRY